MSLDSFRRRRPAYESLARKLEDLIQELLKDAGIDVIQVESRAKTVESFEGKLRRKSYADPLAEMTDLVGLRVITYYIEDVDEVEKILRAEFTVDEENSLDKAAQMDPDRFGYLSRHFVVQLGASRSGLAEWRQYRDIKAEVQVRTALQHAWAAVNHKLEYKSSDEVPAQLRRGLSRLSALFELADEQFSAFRRDSRAVTDQYRDQVEAGERDLPLDADSLAVYLTEAPAVARLADIAHRAEWRIVDLSPAVARDDIMRLSLRAGIRSIRQLDELVPQDDELLLRLYRTLREVGKELRFAVDIDSEVGVLRDLLRVRLDNHHDGDRLGRVYAEVQRRMPELVIRGD
ncbi:MAG TPA: hypothetical protein VGD67_12365 [Pseudonocardiaceae bacterium]